MHLKTETNKVNDDLKHCGFWEELQKPAVSRQV